MIRLIIRTIAPNAQGKKHFLIYKLIRDLLFITFPARRVSSVQSIFSDSETILKVE